MNSEPSNNLNIVNLQTLNLNFPETNSEEVVRAHVISMIDKLFQNGAAIVVVEGEEGIGKTTTLKQFCKIHSSTTFSSFLNPFVKLLSPEDFVARDLYYQIYWLIYGEESPKGGDIDIEDYRKIVSYELPRRLSRSSQTYYFVIDGLDTTNNQQSIDLILDLLPIGQQRFKVLISGPVDSLRKRSGEKVGFAKPVQLAPFSIAETKQYLEKVLISVEDQDVQGLWELSNDGVPGKLFDFLRIIKDDEITTTQLLDDPTKHEQVYNVDWDRLTKLNNQLLNKVVAFVALDDERIYSSDGLALILSSTIDEIKSCLAKVSFIRARQNGDVTFSSVSCRSFFAKKMASYKKFVNDENINFFIRDNQKLEALLMLPRYYRRNDDSRSLIKFLSGDYFPTLINTSQSLSKVMSSVRTGFAAAKGVPDDQSILSFALHGSLINNVEGLHVWESEIDARIALEDYENAITQANSALLREDRLQLLVRIARVRRKKGQVIEDALITQIKELYKNTDLASLGSKMVSIAGDLFYSLPELALELISSSASESNRNVNDWVIARLTLNAIESKEVDVDRITSLISDPKAREIATSLSFLFGEYSHDQIILQAKQLEGPKDRLMFLKIWLAENASSPESAIVVEYAFDQFVSLSASEFAGLPLLLDFTSSLKSIKDTTTREKLIGQFLIFKEDARRSGPTILYFQFIVDLLDAKIIHSYDEGIGYFFELNSMLGSIEDHGVGIECVALLCKCLNSIGNKLNLKRHGYLVNSTRSDLKNRSLELLKKTAYQEETLKDTIKIVASFDPSLAADMCQNVNTLYRREFLVLRAIEGSLQTGVANCSLPTLQKFYSILKNNEAKIEFITIVIDQFDESSKDLFSVDVVKFLVGEVHKMTNLSTKSYCTITLIKMLSKPEYGRVGIPSSAIITDLDSLWTKLSDDIRKIEIGFHIAASLSVVSPVIARKYFDAANELKKTIWLDSVNTIDAYGIFIRLLIRLYCGSSKLGQKSPDQLKKINDLILNIPSISLRVQLWVHLSLSSYDQQDTNLWQQITDDFIKPAMDSITDPGLRAYLFPQVFPLYYLESPISAVEQLKGISILESDYAIESCLNLTLKGMYPGDYSEEHRRKLVPKHEMIISSLALLELIVTDARIYKFIKAICMTMSEKRDYSDSMRDDMTQRLTILIDKKLPNKDFIKHPGYKIVSQAQLQLLERKQDTKETKIKALLDSVDNDVDNESDRAFIYREFGELLPKIKVKSVTPDYLLKKSFAILDSINCDTEFVARIEEYSEHLHKLVPDVWKDKMRLAVDKTMTASTKADRVSVLKRLIDTVYKHDRGFAKTIMNLIDSDESHLSKLGRVDIQRHFKSLETKRSVIDDKVDTEVDKRSVNGICRELLPSLNSGVLVPKKVSTVRYLLDSAISLPIKSSYNVYAFYIQNLIKRLEGPLLRKAIDSSFDSIFSICKIIEVLSKKYRPELIPHQDVDLKEISSVTVVHGDRTSGVSFIKHWLEENAKTYVKISDAYFGTGDLDLIKLILEISKDLKIYVLTSAKGAQNDESNLVKIYSEKWTSISVEAPNETEIAVVSFRKKDKPPIHARYIFCDRSGLNLTGSWHALGTDTKNDITTVDPAKKVTLEEEYFDDYFTERITQLDGDRIDCFRFKLR